MKINGSVPSISMPSADVFTRDFAVPHTPVVIRGAAREWRASRFWSKDYLAQTIGVDTPVMTKVSRNRLYPDLYSADSSGAPTEMRFGDYIDLIWSDNPERSTRYITGDEVVLALGGQSERHTFSPLLEDVSLPPLFEPRRLEMTAFWLGAAGVIAPLHFDSAGCHNLNAQVKGSKRFLLFSPDQQLHLFSGIEHPLARFTNFSQINVEDPDESRFPEWRSAQAVEAILEEGDMLFVPALWYHAVYSVGSVNMNVNFWWRPEHARTSGNAFRQEFLKTLYESLLDGKPVRDTKDIETVQAAIRNLPEGTRQLLRRMERQVFSSN